MATISVIKLDGTQKAWVENQNTIDSHTAIISDHIDTSDVLHNDCICSSVLTASGYEAWATYFSGATVTNINLNDI